MTEKIYGEVKFTNMAGDPVTIGGYTLDEVGGLSDDMANYEMSLYDVVCDMAIEAKVVKDLVAHIRELEAQLGSQNTEK